MFDNMIELRADIPALGEYTVSADFASLMIKEVLDKKPRVIIEAGSGISTVFLAYCLEKLGGGKILSFEHLEKYALQTRKMITQHRLDSVDVEI